MNATPNATGLTHREINLLCTVFRCVPDIYKVVLFGSRAKGTHRPESDIDLALMGVNDSLKIEAIAEALESLPIPYRFDVKSYDGIRSPLLRAHIKRVGVFIYHRDAPDQVGD